MAGSAVKFYSVRPRSSLYIRCLAFLKKESPLLVRGVVVVFLVILAVGSLVVIALFAVKLFLFRARVSGKVDLVRV